MENKELDIEHLSDAEFEALEAKLKQRKADQRKKFEADKVALRQLQDEFIATFFPKLTGIAEQLTLAKAEVFEASQNIINLKKTVLNLTDEDIENQQSHTISTIKFDKSIIIGHNIIDGWDPDIVTAGMSGVNNWIKRKLEENQNNKELIDYIIDLLKPDKNGVLKASRVIDIRNRAEKNNDEELIEHIKMIQSGYRPKKTTTYVKAKFRDENGQDIWLNLSMSNA